MKSLLQPSPSELQKMRNFPFMRLFLVLIPALAISIFQFLDYGLALNTSPSVARGLYLLRPLPKILERGQLVSLCIPNEEAAASYQERKYFGEVSGPCPSGLPRLLKPIGALPGDVVEMQEAGTVINNKLIPGSKVQDFDSKGLPIDHLRMGWMKAMDSGEFFMLSTKIEKSLDSRYYGPVSWTDFSASATPLITE